MNEREEDANLKCVAAVTWLLLAAILFRDLRKWNKRFQELYEDLEKTLNRRYRELTDELGPYDPYTDGYEDVVNAVENFPSTADVAPVVHGRWEDADWYEMDEYGELRKTSNAALRCSNCKNCFEKKALWKENYCPNCGAKMDGGGADG